MLNPEDISGTLTFLLSEKSTHINGQNIITDDGVTL
jgi:enoyl-[acyl-carrier-protein] reductase (NADH)